MCLYELITGLPENVNFDEFDNVLLNFKFDKHPPLPITYLCAFLKSSDEVLKLHQRLKLSTYERDLAYFIVLHKEETLDIDDLE